MHSKYLNQCVTTALHEGGHLQTDGKWILNFQVETFCNATTTRTLSRLTDFIFAAENVGEMICLAVFHVLPLACASPRGVFRFQPKMFGKRCSKEDMTDTHGQQIFMRMQTNYIPVM